MLLLDFIVSSYPFGQNSTWVFLPCLPVALSDVAHLLYRSFNSMSQ